MADDAESHPEHSTVDPLPAEPDVPPGEAIEDPLLDPEAWLLPSDLVWRQVGESGG